MSVRLYRLPHWVYRMHDAEGRLLYIGKTVNPTQRLQNWRAKRRRPRFEWFNDVVLISWRRYANESLAWAAERDAIRAELPLYNRDHNPNFRQAPPKRKATA